MGNDFIKGRKYEIKKLSEIISITKPTLTRKNLLHRTTSRIFPTSIYFIQDKCTVWISDMITEKSTLRSV